MKTRRHTSLILSLASVLACGYWQVARAADATGPDLPEKAAAPAQGQHCLNRPLRVLTANIWNTSGPYAKRENLLRQQIARLDPDLIGFQEAEWTPGQDHQVKQLLAGMDYHIDHQCEGVKVTERRSYDVAIASRWPAARKGLWQFAGGGVALAVEVDAPRPMGRFLFVSTFGTARWQLDCELQRERGAVALDKHIRQTANPQGFPTIIAGDFDATPDSAGMRFLTGLQSLEGHSTHYLDAWKAAGNTGPGYTWTTVNAHARQIAPKAYGVSNLHRRIDYILVGLPPQYKSRIHVDSCRVVLNQCVNDVWPSDHFAVFAEISCR